MSEETKNEDLGLPGTFPREKFIEWAEKANWLPVGETMTMNGRQVQYITPSGNILLAVFDLKGKFFGIAQVVTETQKFK